MVLQAHDVANKRMKMPVEGFLRGLLGLNANDRAVLEDGVRRTQLRQSDKLRTSAL